jgi:hypothetical protein
MRPTVEFILKGGVGNQLFQWCAANRLRAAIGADTLTANTTSYTTDGYNRAPLIKRLFPNLNCIETTEQSRHDSTRVLLETPETRTLIAQLPERVSASVNCKHLLIDGYWQDHRIVTEQLATEINFALARIFPREHTNQLESLRTETYPVAVHIRRHDYAHHGICEINYFIDTVLRICEKRLDSTIHLFSDEPNFAAWAFSTAKININNATTTDPLADLYLMSNCRAHVISNSTFSWWGARLSNSHPVVAPSPWSFIHTPSDYLLPANWIVIPRTVHSPKIESKYFDQINLDNHQTQDTR